MAVKQNNTEGNGSSADANQVNGGNGVKSTGTITKSKKMNPNGPNGEVGAGALASGVGLGPSGNADLPGCSGSTGASSKAKVMSSASNIGSGAANVSAQNNDISYILQWIDLVEMKQQQVDLSKEMLKIYQHLIVKLARVQFPRQSPEDLKRFKEDMAKVGAFFAKSTEKSVYFYSYLPVVCQLITMADGETPSCALAVIFQLFNSEMVVEAVQSLLEHEVPDQNIRKTVCLLCEWLRMCNFCQNLHVWIMVILNGLQKRNKSALVEQIALENIEQLFASLIVPVLRPKVAPIVFLMLSSVDQSPEVFHKILPRFPIVINMLKQQSNSSEEYADSTKKILQQLVDRTSQLMSRFYRYDDLYEPIELALKGFQPSNNYMNYVYGSKSFDSTIDSTQNPNAKVGLVNLGNTCYMNSVLQALAMTKEFSREILLSESKSPLLIKMQQQIAFMLYSTRQELTPSKVLNATRPPGFSPGLQQDSSEFLGYLLETLHEQEVAFRKKTTKTLEHCVDGGIKEASSKIINKMENAQETGASALYKDEEDVDDDEFQGDVENTTTNPNISNTPDAADSIKSTNLHTINKSSSSSSSSSPTTLSSKTLSTATATTSISTNTQNYSTIEKTFTGKLATTYKCLSCGWKSCNIDSFRDLQLSFPDVKNDCASNYSVQDLIEYYCSSEKLYGDNQYFCERCKKLSDAERYINVISAPKNLILTLKHFKYDQKYHMRAKLMHKVFHDEKVSLKVCSSENLEEIATVHYDLYAGVVHSGFSMDSGHYYTYAADASNKWYKFNDSIVTPSKTEELHNLTPPNTPYILFYQMEARSNETPETSASTKVIKVDVPTPLTLEELPRELRDMVTHDNYAFSEELKMRRYKNASSLNANAMKTKDQRRDSFEDDDDEQPPPASGCGGNAMNINMNRFVY
ncbi:ubiquitin carboxyl-terminal hydrolase 35 [Lucilia sericata]|uniref:ubiquitin carboxyl-terminal hydrolase 35 n=1 Tax=Lucilia sericata TaxID=13632 RepID=UPI0018A7FE27|nr:ubiquitin carboxyl-terminal hydrolase 35 [Lucilia sericata]